MSPTKIRRKMENMGYDHDYIETQVDRIADDLVQQERDDNLQELLAMGYTEDDLERSNPYNQWMYQ